MDSYSMVCPFLDESNTYALGVEFGLLFARMMCPKARRIADYFHRSNQEQILLLANRLGWSVNKVEPWDKCWFYCVMEKPC